MSTMKIHIVQGAHPTTPGNPMSAHFSQHEADQAALDLVALIAADVSGAPPRPSDPTMWRSYLSDVQRLIVIDEGEFLTGDEGASELDILTGCHVEIVTLDVPKPRLVVTMEDDAIESISGDVDVELHILDRYVEGMTPEEMVLVPTESGAMRNAHVQRRDVDVRPAWIDQIADVLHLHAK